MNIPGDREQQLKMRLYKVSLLDLLADCGWNKAEAERPAGVSPAAIWNTV